MGADRQLLGKSGEDLAAQALSRRGYTILERNYRCRHGEIDIIGKIDGNLVFVEVKTRKSQRFGSPLEAVTSRKQQQIAKVAQYYLAERGLFDSACRFDVVSVIAKEDGPSEIEILSGAFELNAR